MSEHQQTQRPQLGTCSACGLVVIVEPSGRVIRACVHELAAVLVDIRSAMVGRGGVRG